MVLAQGDTTPVLASALASFYQKISFGHVEASLRTHQLFSPFPEEANRVVAGHLSTVGGGPGLLNGGRKSVQSWDRSSLPISQKSLNGWGCAGRSIILGPPPCGVGRRNPLVLCSSRGPSPAAENQNGRGFNDPPRQRVPC